MRVYKGTDGMTEPVEFECEVFGYPNLDPTGCTMYENAHFLTIGEAWESIRRSVHAYVKLAGAEVQRRRNSLNQAEVDAAEAAVMFSIAMTKYEEFQRSK